MANFFTDNEDIQFHLQNMELAEIVELYENDFEESKIYSEAPENVNDAIDNYKRVLDMIGELSGEFIAPRAGEVDSQGSVLNDGKVIYAKGIAESLEMLAKADLMGFTLPRKYGGLNFPTVIYAMAIDIVSRADASLMNIFGLQGIAETINAFADEKLKEKYLPQFTAGKITGAMALTEPDAGSDLQSVKLTATESDDGTWRLNGVKRFITNGCAEVLLVLARSEPDTTDGLGLSLFLCERGEGVKVRRIEDKLGIHGSPTCELQFTDAPGYLIGETRRGLVTYVMALLNGARIGIAAQSLGIGEAAFREARAFAHTRQQFGRRIETIPAVADMLAEMKVALEAARALTYEATRTVDLEIGLLRKLESGKINDHNMLRKARKDQKKYKRLASLLTPMSKYYSTEMCIRVASDAIQILGGSGYMRDYPVERHFRDARITNIYEGTSQLQIVAAVRGVISGTAEKCFEELAEKADADEPTEQTASSPTLEAPEGKASVNDSTFTALSKKLSEARKLLSTAIDHLKKEGMEYTDLYARKLVDIAIDIIVGYLFLRDAKKSVCCLEGSEHKVSIAKRFIGQLLPRAEMNVKQILSGDRSSLSEFGIIIGSIEEET